MLCCLCHHACYRDAVILQPSTHLKRLIGGDSATNNQQYCGTLPLVGLWSSRFDCWQGGDAQALRINLVAALLQGLTDQRPSPVWQGSFSQIIADRAWTDAEQMLQRFTPTKGCNQRCNIYLRHRKLFHKNSIP